MNIQLDLHTHTLMSGHAFSTLQEMVAEAARREVRYLGITEHGPLIPGACDPIYFRNYYVVPRCIDGVRLLMGAELDIVDYHGSLDLDESYYPRFDHVVAGIHKLCFAPGTRMQNTDAVLGAMHNARVNIISHPADGAAPLMLEPLVKASRETHTLLEVNNSSLNPLRKNPVARENNRELLCLCRKYDVPVILGSDAHIACSIADYTNIHALLEETEFPEQLIVNDDMHKFLDFTELSLPGEP